MPSLNGQDSICRDGSIHDITLHLLLILLIEFFVNVKLLLQETKPAVKIFVIFSTAMFFTISYATMLHTNVSLAHCAKRVMQPLFR